MKLAVSGKGGVGKTTFSALMIRTLNEDGKRVLAIDADPDANLAAAIGIADADKVVPLLKWKTLCMTEPVPNPAASAVILSSIPKWTICRMRCR